MSDEQKNDKEKAIIEQLEQLRGMLQADGGYLELAKIEGQTL